MIENILRIALCVSSTICIWSAFLLAYDWQGVKQRRWLSLVLFLWGLAWASRAYGLIFGNNTSMYNEVFPPALIIVGLLTSVTFLMWPITIVNPIGIRLRTILIFWAPFVLCVCIYWGITGLFGLPRFTFTSLSQFWEHLSYFTVWYRLVMCAFVIGYLVYTMNRTIHYIRLYNLYVEENYAEYEKYTIRWIPTYLGGLVAVSVFYFINLSFASYGTFLCHVIVACAFLAWLSTKVMVYNSPFISDRTAPLVTDSSMPKGEDFNSQFDSYKHQIETWMLTERPYLNADFSLQEIMKRYKLNRTYASRIFNEGFGKSFILVVRDYRIDYARKVIEENPNIAISEVAHECGYSTPQAFHKAFAYCNNGLTPGKFAQTCARK